MNSFVDFINQFYSQNPALNAGYDELSEKKLEGISIPTTQITEKIKSGDIDILILTGNAGDGKTFMCREIHNALVGKSLSADTITEADYHGRKVTIVKDASELSTKDFNNILQKIEKSLNKMIENSSIFIIAGNEGKLSDSFLKNNHRKLTEALNSALRGIYDDESSKKPPSQHRAKLKILNLNWRSLAVKTIFGDIIAAFVKEDNWEKANCSNCDNKSDCPFLFNARMLRNDKTRERIRTHFQLFHYLEGHFTLRELFSAVSYILTSGLSCEKVNELADRDKLSYIFYQNIYSHHSPYYKENSQIESKDLQQDRILRVLKKYDVALAPVSTVNWDIVEAVNACKKGEPLSKNTTKDLDLEWISRALKDKGETPTFLFKYLKRRRFFLDDQLSQEASSSSPNNNSPPQPTLFLPFAGFKDFDDFMSSYPKINEELRQRVQDTIIRGLNLMANKNDPEPGFWLKVYKPQQTGYTAILQLVGDRVEELDVRLSVEKPKERDDYLCMNFMPTRLALTVKIEDKNLDPIRLPINLELYDLLLSIANGNQSRQYIGEINKVIEDFREALFYRLIKSSRRHKFHLNTFDMGYERPLELIKEKDKLFLRG